jgi:hypothetical protein
LPSSTFFFWKYKYRSTSITYLVCPPPPPPPGHCSERKYQGRPGAGEQIGSSVQSAKSPVHHAAKRRSPTLQTPRCIAHSMIQLRTHCAEINGVPRTPFVHHYRYKFFIIIKLLVKVSFGTLKVTHMSLSDCTLIQPSLLALQPTTKFYFLPSLGILWKSW